MTKLFSVLVPAYNVEKYLEACIESILGQEEENLEIIIVDDGSADQTLSISKLYEQRDSRIIVQHQSNHGIIYTRNRLLSLAKGEWVVFVDADDTITPDYLSSFYDCIKDNQCVDVVACDYYRMEQGGVCKEIKSPFSGKTDYLRKMLGWREINTALWGKAIRREFISSHDFKFEPGIVLGEDLCFMSRLFYYANDIAYIPKSMYYWNKTNAGSITALNKYIAGYIPLYDKILMFYKMQPDYYLFSKTLNNTLAMVVYTLHSYGQDHESIVSSSVYQSISTKHLSCFNHIRYWVVKHDNRILTSLMGKAENLCRKIFREVKTKQV